MRPVLLCGLIGCLAAGVAGADEKPDKLTICTWNLEWFFDEHTGDNFAELPKKQAAPSREDWDWKLAGVASVLGKLKPTIVALQEIENRRVLFYLTQKLRRDYDLNYRIAYIEGEDFFTEQDVAILSTSGLVEFRRRERSREEFENEEFQALTKHLFADFAWGSGQEQVKLTLLNLHTRATPEAANLRQKQARLARHWLQQQIELGENVIILGDLNSNELASETTKTGDIGIFRGLDTAATADDLFDTLATLANPKSPTHLTGRQFDRILLSRPLTAKDSSSRGISFRSIALRRDLVIRGSGQDKDHFDVYWQIPAAERDISDHYPLVAEFEFR
jgi:endonuclease/exonuclease/phosphatase family metal-dependent hydrolase